MVFVESVMIGVIAGIVGILGGLLLLSILRGRTGPGVCNCRTSEGNVCDQSSNLIDHS